MKDYIRIIIHMNTRAKVFLILTILLVLAVNATITWIDRTPYREKAYFDSMQDVLDSLENNWPKLHEDSLEIGWAKVSITTDASLPLAGYGARDPKTLTGVHDSTFIRATVFKNGQSKLAILSAELLINHPEVVKVFYKELESSAPDFEPEEIFLTATHTHSGLGSWAPGIVGELFAGPYQDSLIQWIAVRMAKSVRLATENLSQSDVSYMELSMSDWVENRVVKEKGKIDPWFKVITFNRENDRGIIGAFSAHATCLGHTWTKLSGDYPGVFMRAAKADFVSFSAGPVGSMAPINDRPEWDRAMQLGQELAKQIDLVNMLQPQTVSTLKLTSTRIPLSLGTPELKITRNLVTRPWIFRKIIGEYDVSISIAQVHNILMIGLPCDFSGELALPLYHYARDRGLNLIISSFNGGYIGYVPDDRWYDLDTYETRTMSWYGHDTGAYFSEIIKKIIDIASDDSN